MNITKSAAACAMGGPPFFMRAPRAELIRLTGTVEELWTISALILAGVILGALFLAVLGVSNSERGERRDRD